MLNTLLHYISLQILWTVYIYIKVQNGDYFIRVYLKCQVQYMLETVYQHLIHHYTIKLIY